MASVTDIERGTATRAIEQGSRSRAALVLGGGGFTGAVYEIGALSALDLLAVNGTVNDFDLYVGTSAGSFVAAMLASGITPDEMMETLAAEPGSRFDGIELGQLLRPNYRGIAAKAIGLPGRLMGMARELVPRIGEISLVDAVIALAEAMPTGVHSGAGIREYVAGVLAAQELADDFAALERELYITATDLDTCERIVFGEGEWTEVPVSKAVECSTALPVMYAPVELRGRHLIDGGIPSTTNVDVAVERGAKFIVVINPLVPYINDFRREIPDRYGMRAHRVADFGMPAVAYQSFKLIAHARLHQAVRFWEEKYPGVDIVLVEPEPGDELMFGTSVLDFSKRREIAEHGFATIKGALAADYDRYSAVAGRHGIEISGERLERLAT